jgi:peptide/nickel transport system substrate-binding protein
VAALTACAGNPEATPDTPSGPNSADAPAVLRIGLNRTIGNLDPAEGAEGNATGSIKAALYSSLTWIDATGQTIGDLATEWSQTAQLEWTFTIRDDAEFTDGTAVDAQAIKANFDRLLDPGAALADAGAIQLFIESVATPDPETLIITTKYPYIHLPERLTTIFFASPEFLAKGENLATVAVGSGPYLLESVDPENGAVLVVNPGYYGQAPAFTRVEYTALPSETARVTAAQTESVDFLNGLDPLDLEQFAGSAKYDTEVTASYWVQTLRINETVPAVADQRVRQAINYAIDKQALIDAFLGGAVEPAKGQVLVPGYETFNPSLTAYPYDPDKARQLLAQAGYPDGVDISLVYPDGSYLAGNQIAEAISAQLAEVGIRVALNPLQFLNYIQETETEDGGPLFYQGWGGNYPIAADRLSLYASSHQNVHKGDPEFDQYVLEAARATTVEAEQEAVNKATQYQFDQAHVVFLFQQPLSYVIDKNINWTPRREGWIRAQDFTLR